MAIGNRASLRGLNVVGMKRSGVPRAEIFALRKAYKMIFDRARPVSENLAMVKQEFAGSPTVGDVVAFLEHHEKRPFIVPRLGRSVADDDDDEA
jgi:UDP-N-acetylglucosamine acyltransferase